MEEETSNKQCGMCCMEIPAGARKCPQCHHFQSRWSMVMFHPGFGAVFALLPLLAMVFVIGTLFDEGEEYQVYKDEITITDSEMVFGDTDRGATVAVIGTVRNSSSVPWKELQFHVDFFDNAGQKVDVGQKRELSFYVPANDEVSFKLSFYREFPQTDYASSRVRLLAAKDARAKW